MSRFFCFFTHTFHLLLIEVQSHYVEQTSKISVIADLYLNIVSLAFLDFELSDAQYVHALSIEHLVPGLSDLKIQICSTDMTEACFWKIYFVLLHTKLNKQDAELLSTPQVIS
jgi:hypothetical protein